MTAFYSLFDLDGLQTNETECNPKLAAKTKQRSRFNIVRDSRNRKVRGL